METQTVVKALNTSPTVEVDYESILEPVPLKYGISVMLLSIFFFETINKLITGLNPKVDSNARQVQHDFWKWKNLVISWVHAGTVAMGAIYSLCTYGKEISQDMIAYHNPVIYVLLCFTTGYFMYDFMDLWRNNYARKMWELVIHHISVTAMFFYNVAISRCIAFNTVTLVVEINSFFLHSRKLIQLQNPKMDYSDWTYRIVCWCNLLTFIAFRFGTIVLIFYGIRVMGHRVSQVYLTGLSATTVIFLVINVVLFWRLFKTDVIKYYWKKRKPTPSTCNNNVKDSVHAVGGGDDVYKNGYVQNGHVDMKEKSS